jgi:beta-lactamase class A
VPERANASFAALANHLAGGVGLAVAPLGEGPVQTFGSLQAGHAWSTMKVPVLAALLANYEQSGKMLSPEQNHNAMLALEQSDNAAGEALFGNLEQIYGGLVPASEAVQETLRNAGDQNSTINTAPNHEGFPAWEQSTWSPSGQVLFYRTLARGCLLRSFESSEYVLQLMRRVIPSQRWGVGAAGYPRTEPLAFKGGWGPEHGAGYLVRQTAIVGTIEHGYVVSMVARPAGGSFAQGVSMVNALAAWTRKHVSSNGHEALPRCVSE